VSPAPDPDALSSDFEKRLLGLTVVVAAVLLLVLGGLSYLLWHGRLGPAPIVMYVPVPILEWAFAGALVSVLYRLAYRKSLPRTPLGLYTWAVAKPIVGLFTGACIYFLALAAAKLLDGSPEALQQALWLNVVAFVGGFSDELSVGLINRFVRRRLGADRDAGE